MAGADLRAALVASCFLGDGGVSYLEDYNTRTAILPWSLATSGLASSLLGASHGVGVGATAEVAGELMTVEQEQTYLYPIYVCSFVSYVNNYKYTVFVCYPPTEMRGL